MIRKISSFFCILLTLSKLSFGVTYHVGTAGNDYYSRIQAQNVSTPWKTIQNAANNVSAGDSVLISGGIYNEYITLPLSCSGNPSAFITFQGKTNENVVIDGKNSGWTWIALIACDPDNANHHIIFKNLKLQNSYFFGFRFNNCNNIIVDNCKTYNTGGSGIYVNGGSNIFVTNNDINKACTSTDLTTNSQECISLGDISRFDISGNTVYTSGGGKTGGEGIDAKGACSNGIISGNYIHDISSDRVGLYIDAWDKKCHNIIIDRNRIVNTKHGIAISGEKGGTVDSVFVTNNLCYNNTDNGICTFFYGNGILKNIYIVNNTCSFNNSYGTVFGGGIWQQNKNAATDNIIIRNNICSNNGTFQIKNDRSTGVTIDHNLIYYFVGATGETMGTEYVSGDPRFVDAVNFNFTIRNSSPAVDSGSPLMAPNHDYLNNPRPVGAFSDIGAFENQSVLINGIQSERVVEPGNVTSSIFPNPATLGFFYLKSIGFRKHVSIQIIDISGKLIYSREYTYSDLIEVINQGILHPGFYYVMITDGEKKACNKLVVE